MADSPLRDLIVEMYHAAVERVDAGASVRRVLTLRSDGSLEVNERIVADNDAEIWAIAIGKAGCQMMAAAEEVLGDRLQDGIVVTKQAPEHLALRSTVLLGSHPVPDSESVAAGQRLIEFAQAVPQGAVVLCLISGGGSALVEALRPGISLDTLRDITQELLRGGASIRELNAVRSRLSLLKSGGLLNILSGRSVVNLVVSDVLGNPLTVIASGPTVPPDMHESAEAVVERFGLKIDLPEASERRGVEPLTSCVVADLAAAMEAAADVAREQGLAVHLLGGGIDIEAREAGRMFGSIVAETISGRTSFASPCCIVAGGETVVHVTGDGVGGRNCEAAVAAALRIARLPGCAIGCLATDGDDGVSGAAGGVVDGTTVDDPRSAEQTIAASDTFTWLNKRGAALVTGPTGTNVNDLMIGVIAPEGWTST
ncbi:MAG: DUF4147 domain-containing protein [Thermomicrobiales bacterium]|nr:DUF4147 domain-containing protein [Thermomicrobiales bacterium]